MTALRTAQAHSRLSNYSLVSVLSAHRPAFQGGERGTGVSGKDSASLSLSVSVGFFPPPPLLLSSERQNVSISQSGRGHRELPSQAVSRGRDLEGSFLPSSSSLHLLHHWAHPHLIPSTLNLPAAEYLAPPGSSTSRKSPR